MWSCAYLHNSRPPPRRTSRENIFILPESRDIAGGSLIESRDYFDSNNTESENHAIQEVTLHGPHGPLHCTEMRPKRDLTSGRRWDLGYKYLSGESDFPDTILKRADGGYRVTRDPGLRARTLEEAGGSWSPAPPRLDPDIKNYFQDSSIGARRAGGEARFEALTTFSSLLRAARRIVKCVRNASRTRR